MRKIRLSKSSVRQEEKDAVLRVLDKEYLGMGDDVRIFEENIRSYISTDNSVVCVNTGTSALHLSLVCLGIKEGDEVLLPSLTYVATFQAVSGVGAKPVYCDVTEDDLFIDLEYAERMINERTKVIIPVHYASNSIKMNKVYELAARYNLRVIEDAAHSFGCERNNRKIGDEGDIVCFSFDGIKNITSGEGGAIVSKDADFIAKVKDARLLGVEKDTEKRYAGQRSWDFDVKYQGYRYHMSNIMAAIGIEQLKRIDYIKQQRQGVAAYYLNNISMKEIEFLNLDYNNIIPHIFVVKAKDRDALREFLISEGVECGIHYKPNHLLSKYNLGYHLPVTEKIYEEIITLPCHLDLSEDDLNYVVAKIREFYGK